MLGDWLGPVQLAVDTDQISELAEDRAQLWEQVGAASFLSDAEKREMLGFAGHAQRDRDERTVIERGGAAGEPDGAGGGARGGLITLRALVEESSQAGARRALASLGLDDERARRDMDELRELLSAWRDAKRSAWRAVVSWVGAGAAARWC